MNVFGLQNVLWEEESLQFSIMFVVISAVCLNISVCVKV